MGILSGIAIPPDDRRRAGLAEAAVVSAEVFAARRTAGIIDLMRATIPRVRGAGVAARTVADVQGVGLTTIAPWTGRSAFRDHRGRFADALPAWPANRR